MFACVCLFECVRLWRNKEREQQLTATAVYQAAGIVLFAEAHNKWGKSKQNISEESVSLLLFFVFFRKCAYVCVCASMCVAQCVF